MNKKECLESLVWVTDGIADDLHTRNVLIRLARENGASVKEIANHAGMSRQGIAKILNKTVDNSVVKT